MLCGAGNAACTAMLSRIQVGFTTVGGILVTVVKAFRASCKSALAFRACDAISVLQFIAIGAFGLNGTATSLGGSFVNASIAIGDFACLAFITCAVFILALAHAVTVITDLTFFACDITFAAMGGIGLEAIAFIIIAFGLRGTTVNCTDFVFACLTRLACMIACAAV